MNKFISSVALMLSLFTAVAFAQKNDPTSVHTDYNKAWYVGLNGGASTKFTNNDWFKNINPSIGIRGGKWLTPHFGIEIEADAFFSRKQFNTFKSGWAGDRYPQYEGVFDNPLPESGKVFKAISAGANLKFNLSNIFCGKKEWPRTFELIANIGGAFGYDFTDDISSLYKSINSHAGLQAAFNFGDKQQWQAYIEPNIVWDMYDRQGRDTYFDEKGFQPNKIIFHSDRIAMQVKIGINYKFGKAKAAPVVVPPAEPKPVVAPKPEPKPVVKKVVPAEKKIDVFFLIRSSEIREEELSKVQDMIAFLKANPQTKVTVTGYADKETGNPKINMGYSEDRAKAIAEALINGGIDASRITTDAKGDTVQPYAENDLNRVTIAIAKE